MTLTVSCASMIIAEKRNKENISSLIGKISAKIREISVHKI